MLAAAHSLTSGVECVLSYETTYFCEPFVYADAFMYHDDFGSGYELPSAKLYMLSRAPYWNPLSASYATTGSGPKLYPVLITSLSGFCLLSAARTAEGVSIAASNIVPASTVAAAFI